MTHAMVARWMLSVLCVAQALGTVAIDMNRTHAAHPQWPGHARFHVVWQTSSVVLLSVVAMGLLWWGGGADFYAAVGLAGVPPVGFLVASMTMGIYSGTLTDAGGVPTAKVRVLGRVREVDMNVVVVVLALLWCAACVVVYRG